MLVECPQCGSSELALVEVLEDERRRIGCELCGHQWLQGEAKRASPRGRPTREPAEAKPPAVFVDDDAGYLAWVRTWAGGHVPNSDRHPQPNYLMVHRADYDTITEPGSRETTWDHEVHQGVLDRSGGLGGWANRRTSAKPAPCQVCK